ncbi:hypothetical protein PMAYCL1PPCAC_18779, partial [Pristionchus mayeri]
IQSVQPSDSKSTLISKTGHARSSPYCRSLGPLPVSSSTSVSLTSLHSKSGSIIPSSQNPSPAPSSSDISIASA